MFSASYERFSVDLRSAKSAKRARLVQSVCVIRYAIRDSVSTASQKSDSIRRKSLDRIGRENACACALRRRRAGPGRRAMAGRGVGEQATLGRPSSRI
jgi:hypothetical protein